MSHVIFKTVSHGLCNMKDVIPVCGVSHLTFHLIFTFHVPFFQVDLKICYICKVMTTERVNGVQNFTAFSIT